MSLQKATREVSWDSKMIADPNFNFRIFATSINYIIKDDAQIFKCRIERE